MRAQNEKAGRTTAKVKQYRSKHILNEKYKRKQTLLPVMHTSRNSKLCFKTAYPFYWQ